MINLATQLGVISVYLAYLLGPGYVVVRLIGIRRNIFLLSYGISICLLVVSQIPFRFSSGNPSSWFLTLHILLVVLFLVCWSVGRFGSGSYTVWRHGKNRQRVGGFVAIIILFAIYHLVTGPYTEVPSDFWSHLGRVKEQLFILEQGQFPIDIEFEQVIRGGAYIPFLHAAVAKHFGVPPINIVPSVTLVTSAVFLGAVYWFTLSILRCLSVSASIKVGIAVLAVVFSLAAFGVSSFSYVRYYAYFPHILNLSLMFVVMALYIDYLERPEISVLVLVPVVLFILLSVLINEQETLFTLIMLSGVTIWRALRTFKSSAGFEHSLARRSRVLGMAIVGLIVTTVTYSFLVMDSSDWGRPHIIDLGNVNRFLSGLPIANPKLRFWDTVGLHGVVIYGWYLFQRKSVSQVDYINFGMVVPLVTLFNPVFVLWFLRVGTWDSLWRIAYLMPLSIVAAVLVGTTVGHVWNDKLYKRIPELAIVFAVFCTLIPFSTRYIVNDTSRFPSLMALEETNGALLWSDLISALNDIGGQRLLITDYVTNYVLSTATRHAGKGEPKELWQRKRESFRGDYKDRLLYYGVDDGLVVINHKDGFLSETGRKSGHWWPDILEVAKLYPNDLHEFLDGHPNDFRLVWSSEKSFVYEILRDPSHY